MARDTTEDGGTARRRVSVKAIVVAVVVVLVIVWALANSQRVQVDWIVGETDSPLVIVIASAALVGFVAGYLVAHLRNRKPD